MTAAPRLILHNYWRSTSSYRVRIALAWKQLAYDYAAVNLLAGAQRAAAHLARNPLGQVPVLEVDDGDGVVRRLTQSVAILEYLEERWPTPPLLPGDPYLRARVRALVELINAGVQPFQNLPVLARARALGVDAAAWVHPYLTDGLVAFAGLVADTAGAFCVGDAPTLADVLLVPQLVTVRRFAIELPDACAPLLAIEARCLALPAFASAHPDVQPDAVTL